MIQSIVSIHVPASLDLTEWLGKKDIQIQGSFSFSAECKDELGHAQPQMYSLSN